MSGAINFPVPSGAGQTLSGRGFVWDGEKWVPGQPSIGDGFTIYRNGLLNPGFAAARTQTSTHVAIQNSAGVWVERSGSTSALPVPLISSEGRLIVTGSRTNQLRNPRGEGGVAGTPGTIPTNWAGTTTGSGLSREIVLLGKSDEGIDFVRIRVSGTTTAASVFFNVANFESTNVTASAGQTWTASMFCRLHAGALTGVNMRHEVPRFTAGYVGSNTLSFTPTGAALGTQRYTYTTTVNDVGLTAINYDLQVFIATSGTVVDFTVDVGWPQLELASFASPPILPQPGTLAASTKGHDLINAVMGDFGIVAPVCTLIWSGVLGQTPPSGVSQTILHVDWGTNDNSRYQVRTLTGSSSIIVQRNTSGFGQTNVSIGTMTPGTRFSVAMTIDGTGRAAASMNGGAVGQVTGGPTGTNVNRIRLGNNFSQAEAMWGETESFEILPYAVSDDVLRSLSLNAGRIVPPGTEVIRSAAEIAPAAFNGAFVSGLRNVLINPKFEVNTRQVSSITNTLGGYPADRWQVIYVGGSRTCQRVALANSDRQAIRTESLFCMEYATTGGTNTGDYEVLSQRIESVRTLENETCTLSFWARRTAGSGNLSTELLQVFGTGGSPSSSVSIGGKQHTLSTSWERFTFTTKLPTVAGKTLGTLNDDYLMLLFWLSANSDAVGRTDALAAQTITVQIADVQLEAGPVATEFERRPFVYENILCQRYCVARTMHAQTSTTGTMITPFYFPLPMRVTPGNTVLSAGTGVNATINVEGAQTNLGGYFQITTTANGGSWLDRTLVFNADY